MSKKQCPYCGKDIPSEAVLCKFCHNLLIDEAGDMSDGGDDRTRVFKKQELEDEEGMTRRFKVPDDYIEDSDDYAPRPRRQQPQFRNEDYDEYDDFEEYYDENEDSRKKMFIFVAFITVGLLIVVIAAVIVAMKLFGGNKNNNQNNSVPAPPAQTQQVQQQEPAPAETAAPPVTTTAAPDTTIVLTEASSAADSVIILEPDSEDETAMSSAADTMSDSSADESTGENFVVGGGSSSSSSGSANSGDSSSSDSSKAPQLSGGDYEETIYNAIKDRLDGELTSSQFREDDGYTVYYYFFTDGGAHGYSVAYDKTTGEVVLDQNY